MMLATEQLFSNSNVLKKHLERDFPGGPVAKTLLPIQGAQDPSLVRELDLMGCNQKVPCVATKDPVCCN